MKWRHGGWVCVGALAGCGWWLAAWGSGLLPRRGVRSPAGVLRGCRRRRLRMRCMRCRMRGEGAIAILGGGGEMAGGGVAGAGSGCGRVQEMVDLRWVGARVLRGTNYESGSGLVSGASMGVAGSGASVAAQGASVDTVMGML